MAKVPMKRSKSGNRRLRATSGIEAMDAPLNGKDEGEEAEGRGMLVPPGYLAQSGAHFDA